MIRKTLVKLFVGAGFALSATIMSLPPAVADDVVRVGEGPFITGGGFFCRQRARLFQKDGHRRSS
jgi:hypothetical protein